MSVDLLKNIIHQCPKDKALLGLDVGKKTIGLALSDPILRVATPLETIKRTKFTQDIQALKKVVENYEVGGFVIGLPVNMDGSEGPRAQSVRDFALELYKQLPVIMSSSSLSSCGLTAGSNVTGAIDPAVKSQGDSLLNDPWIALWDERLSTVSVKDFVDEVVEKRKTRVESKQSGLIDKLAAQHILQSAMNALY